MKNTLKSSVKESKFLPGSYYAEINNQSENTDSIQRKVNKRFVQFYYCTKGRVTFNFDEISYRQILEEGHYFLLFQPFEDLPLNLSVAAGSNLQILALPISDLHRLILDESIGFSNSLLEGNNRIYQKQPITHFMQSVLKDLREKQIPVVFEKAWVKSQVMELLIGYFLEQENKEQCPYLDHEETLLKIKKAKNLLVFDLKTSPSLLELSEQVGLSEFKLKEGFKKVYGEPLHQYLIQHKMKKAHELLLKGQMKVKQIAIELGYNNPSHFISAFKKRYGKTPKQLTMNPFK